MSLQYGRDIATIGCLSRACCCIVDEEASRVRLIYFTLQECWQDPLAFLCGWRVGRFNIINLSYHSSTDPASANAVTRGIGRARDLRSKPADRKQKVSRLDTIWTVYNRRSKKKEPYTTKIRENFLFTHWYNCPALLPIYPSTCNDEYSWE